MLNTARRTLTRSGFTLTETLIAATILCILLVAVLDQLVVTQRQANSGEALLHSSVLAQLVVERVRANTSMNPRYLRDLTGGAPTWSFTGTVIDPASAVNPGGTLKLSPFFEFLLARDSADLCALPNKVPIAPLGAPTVTGIQPPEMGALVEAFRDYKVTVQIENDVDLDTPAAPTAYIEAVKLVTVRVARTSVEVAAGEDPLAHTSTARLATPYESLSKAAFDLIANRFEGSTLEQRWTDFFGIAGTNPYITAPEVTLDGKKLLADAFLILAVANNEAMVIDQAPVAGSIVLGATPGANYIESYIAKFSAPGTIELSSSKKELAKLRARKAAVIFDGFKRSQLPMQHMCQEVFGPLLPPRKPVADRVRALKLQLDATFAAFTALQAAADTSMGALVAANTALTGLDPLLPPTDPDVVAAKAALGAAQGGALGVIGGAEGILAALVTAMNLDKEVVTLAAFLQQFYSDPAYQDVAARPAAYPQRFEKTLEELSGTLSAHLDQATGVTGYERMGAAKMFVESTAARQLRMNAPDPVAQARLLALAGQVAPRTAELARYLGDSEVHDLVQLKGRHSLFAVRVLDLGPLCGKYKEVVTFFGPGGEAEQMLTQWDTVFGKSKDAKIDKVKDTLEKLQKLLDDLF